MLNSEPNIYTVWITLITTVFPPLVAVFAVWVAKKLNAIHILTNGNLHTAQKKVTALRAKLSDHGLDPDAD